MNYSDKLKKNCLTLFLKRNKIFLLQINAVFYCKLIDSWLVNSCLSTSLFNRLTKCANYRYSFMLGCPFEFISDYRITLQLMETRIRQNLKLNEQKTSAVMRKHLQNRMVNSKIKISLDYDDDIFLRDALDTNINYFKLALQSLYISKQCRYFYLMLTCLATVMVIWILIEGSKVHQSVLFLFLEILVNV
jgi:ABC-type multidrug transport system fused ATPase/permease subunit